MTAESLGPDEPHDRIDHIAAEDATSDFTSPAAESASEVLDRIRAADIRLWVDHGTLHFDAPPGALDSELRVRLRHHKTEIMAMLRMLHGVAASEGTLRPEVNTAESAEKYGRLAAELDRRRSAVSQFRRRLENIAFVMVLRAFGHSGLHGSDIAGGASSYPRELADAVNLMVLSRPVPSGWARHFLTAEIADYLLTEGLAEERDGLFALPELRLVEHLGALVFVGADPGTGPARFGYYGAPSVALGRQLLAAAGRSGPSRCLDNFAGTGAQTALLGPGAREVAVVECDAMLAPALALNLALNDLLDSTDVRWADATTTDLAGEFDLVAMHPPTLPSFGLRPGWQADGGHDGCRILETAMRRVELAPDGLLFAVAIMVGDQASGPQTSWLRELAAERRWSVAVLETGFTALEAGSLGALQLADTFADRGAGSARSVMAELAQVWQSTGVTRMFRCLLRITPSSSPSVVRIQMRNGGGQWI
jgi:hypothetical protein